MIDGSHHTRASKIKNSLNVSIALKQKYKNGWGIKRAGCWTKAARRKSSLSHCGQIAWNKGLTKETDDRVLKYSKSISLGLHRLYANGFVNPMKGKHFKMSEIQRKNVSLSLINKPKSVMHNHNVSLAITEKWKNEEYAKSIIKATHPKQNKAERHLDNILQEYFPNEWKYVGSGDFFLNGKNPDFMNVNGKKLLIELYGERWHNKSEIDPRKEIFAEYGFDTLFIWESELEDRDGVVDKIENFGGVQSE